MMRIHHAIAIAASLLGALLALAQNRQLDRPIAAERATAKFPLKVSSDRRYLVDQDNRPFLVVGDTPWSLIADLKRRISEPTSTTGAGAASTRLSST